MRSGRDCRHIAAAVVPGAPGLTARCATCPRRRVVVAVTRLLVLGSCSAAASAAICSAAAEALAAASAASSAAATSAFGMPKNMVNLRRSSSGDVPPTYARRTRQPPAHVSADKKRPYPSPTAAQRPEECRMISPAADAMASPSQERGKTRISSHRPRRAAVAMSSGVLSCTVDGSRMAATPGRASRNSGCCGPATTQLISVWLAPDGKGTSQNKGYESRAVAPE